MVGALALYGGEVTIPAGSRWRAKDPEAARAYQRDWRKKRQVSLRAEAIEVLGGKCARCGLDDHRVLQFDHVHGGGHRERNTQDRLKLYMDVSKRRREDIQLLCANCHVLKTHHDG